MTGMPNAAANCCNIEAGVATPSGAPPSCGNGSAAAGWKGISVRAIHLLFRVVMCCHAVSRLTDKPSMSLASCVATRFTRASFVCVFPRLMQTASV